MANYLSNEPTEALMH